MTITLHNLHPAEGATREKKRLGRGRGSGKGKTSGKGVKGQKARPAHHGARYAFEGGQMPMPRRIGKRGFTNPNRIDAYPINVSTLDSKFETGETVDVASLRAKGMLPKLAQYVKILGEGEVTKKLTVRAYGVSAVAKEKLEKVGGTVEVIGRNAAPSTKA